MKITYIEPLEWQQTFLQFKLQLRRAIITNSLPAFMQKNQLFITNCEHNFIHRIGPFKKTINYSEWCEFIKSAKYNHISNAQAICKKRLCQIYKNEESADFHILDVAKHITEDYKWLLKYNGIYCGIQISIYWITVQSRLYSSGYLSSFRAELWNILLSNSKYSYIAFNRENRWNYVYWQLWDFISSLDKHRGMPKYLSSYYSYNNRLYNLNELNEHKQQMWENLLTLYNDVKSNWSNNPNSSDTSDSSDYFE